MIAVLEVAFLGRCNRLEQRSVGLEVGDAVAIVRPPEAIAVVARYALVVVRPSEEADRFADGLSRHRGRAVLSPCGFDAP